MDQTKKEKNSFPSLKKMSLPENYGYVFGAFGFSFFMNTFLIVQVVNARKLYNVNYPLLYAPDTNEKAEKFNSVQRAHQNTLESYPIVMVGMFACGLKHPITSAVCGMIYSVGRIIYGYGYAKYGPQSRMIGGIISHIGDFPLLLFIPLKIAYDSLTKY